MSMLEGTQLPADHEPGVEPSSRCQLMPSSDPIEGSGGQRSEIQYHGADVQTLQGPRGRRRRAGEVMGGPQNSPDPWIWGSQRHQAVQL